MNELFSWKEDITPKIHCKGYRECERNTVRGITKGKTETGKGWSHFRSDDAQSVEHRYVSDRQRKITDSAQVTNT